MGPFELEQGTNLLDAPNVVRNTCRHRRGHLHSRSLGQGLVRPGEVVEHERQSQGMSVHLQRLAKRVGKPGHAPILHPQGQVASLDVASAYLRVQRVAYDRLAVSRRADRRRVPANHFLILAKHLDHDAVINILAECDLNGILVSTEPVCRKLNPLAESVGQVVNEVPAISLSPTAQMPSDNQLRIAIQSRPAPCVTLALLFLVWRGVFFLAADERPDFVALHDHAAQLSQVVVLVVRARFAERRQEPSNGVLARACCAAGRPDAHALAEKPNNFRLLSNR